MRRQKLISKDFLKLAFRRAVLKEMAAVIDLVGCAGSAAVIGWIVRLLLWLVVRTQTPRFAALFGGKDADPILLEEVTNTSLPGSGDPGVICYSPPPDRT